MITKKCTLCEESLSLDDFNTDSRRKDGKRSSCRSCDAERKKKSRYANIEEYRIKNNERNRLYRERKRQRKWADE